MADRDLVDATSAAASTTAARVVVFPMLSVMTSSVAARSDSRSGVDTLRPVSHSVEIPADLASRAALGPEWIDWLDRLPSLLVALLDEWRLRPSGTPMNGFCSIVVPVLTEDGGDAVLKISFDGDDESAFEALGLATWDGDGVVRMLRADPRRRALLLERLEDRDLSDLWDLEACEIVASFYPRLHRPAPKRLPLLTDFVAPWLDAMADDAAIMPVPRRLVDQALHVGRSLVADPQSVGTLIHGDLHYGNVLAGGREPWLVIDPKPMSGDSHYEVAPLLWDRWDDVEGDVRGAISRRVGTVVDAAEFDEDRARDWVIVRTVLNAHWTVEDARRARRGLAPSEHEVITRSIAVAKAVQP